MKLAHLSPLVAVALMAVASPTFAAKAPVAPVSATATFSGDVIAVGVGTAVLKNSNGVEVRLHAQDKGLELNLAVSGVDITLDK